MPIPHSRQQATSCDASAGLDLSAELRDSGCVSERVALASMCVLSIPAARWWGMAANCFLDVKQNHMFLRLGLQSRVPGY
jgi:hypothetical protein